MNQQFEVELNLSTQWYRNKVRDKIEVLIAEKKRKLFIYLYCNYVDLKRLKGLFKCSMEHITELLVELNIKRCSQCKEIKTRDQFWKHKTNVEKLYTKCINCSLDDQRKPEHLEDRRIKRKIHNQKPKVKLQHAEYMRKRKQTDSLFKLRTNFSTRMANSLKKYSKGKLSKNNNSIFELIDYDIETLAIHLEQKFLSGMTWNNYGQWHIDHKKPISSFNIISLECDDFKKCWSLDNLQPLWAEDNLKKSNKII
jgi:hypothetical protein